MWTGSDRSRPDRGLFCGVIAQQQLVEAPSVTCAQCAPLTSRGSRHRTPLRARPRSGVLLADGGGGRRDLRAVNHRSSAAWNNMWEGIRPGGGLCSPEEKQEDEVGHYLESPQYNQFNCPPSPSVTSPFVLSPCSTCHLRLNRYLRTNPRRQFYKAGPCE